MKKGNKMIMIGSSLIGTSAEDTAAYYHEDSKGNQYISVLEIEKDKSYEFLSSHQVDIGDKKVIRKLDEDEIEDERESREFHFSKTDVTKIDTPRGNQVYSKDIGYTTANNRAELVTINGKQGPNGEFDHKIIFRLTDTSQMPLSIFKKEPGKNPSLAFAMLVNEQGDINLIDDTKLTDKQQESWKELEELGIEDFKNRDKEFKAISLDD